MDRITPRPPLQTYALQASQYSDPIPTGLHVTKNIDINSGFVVSAEPTKETRVGYDLKNNQVHLPMGRYILEIEYSSSVLIPEVALHANDTTKSLNFPPTGGNGLNVRNVFVLKLFSITTEPISSWTGAASFLTSGHLLSGHWNRNWQTVDGTP